MAKIRGVESFGMMCSARELELGDDHDGIIEAPANAKVGEPVALTLGASDPVIEFEVTPNRPDWLSHIGIALPRNQNAIEMTSIGSARRHAMAR